MFCCIFGEKVTQHIHLSVLVFVRGGGDSLPHPFILLNFYNTFLLLRSAESSVLFVKKGRGLGSLA